MSTRTSNQYRTRKEADALLREYLTTRNPHAQEELIRAYEPLAIAAAREYETDTIDADDLLQQGRIGIWLALEEYDPDMGNRFASLAKSKVKWAVAAYARQHKRNVRFDTTDEGRRIWAGRSSTGLTDMETEALEEHVTHRETSMHSIVATSDDGTPVEVEDTLVDDKPTPEWLCERKEREELRARLLSEFASTLDALDLDIFRKRLLSEESLTHEELADAYGVERSTVSRREKALLGRLAAFLTPYREEIL